MGTESKLWPLRKRLSSQHPQRETQLAQTLSSPRPFLQSAWKHRTRNSAPPAPPSKSKTKRCEMERWLRKPPDRIWGLLCPGPPHLARRQARHGGFRHKQLRTPRCPRRGKRRRPLLPASPGARRASAPHPLSCTYLSATDHLTVSNGTACRGALCTHPRLLATCGDAAVCGTRRLPTVLRPTWSPSAAAFGVHRANREPGG